MSPGDRSAANVYENQKDLISNSEGVITSRQSLTTTRTNCKYFHSKTPAGVFRENQSDNVLTIKALAAHMKISKSTRYQLVREGKIPAPKVGRRLLFHKEVIDR
jgi:excisionase family DNA binding protein